MQRQYLSPCGRGRDPKGGAGEGSFGRTLMLKKFKKILRKHQTDAESQLWYHLRARRLRGWKFRRQHILQGYIVDFVCLEKKLVVELDGGQHADQKAYDARRSRILEKNGFKVIRFWNNDVLNNLEGVLEMIFNTPHPPLRDDLSHKGRGEGSEATTSSTKGEVKEMQSTTSPLVGEVATPKGERVRGLLGGHSKKSFQAGFSLVEMALVLVILGIIGGMGLPLLTAHIKRSALTKTREHQEYALNAIAAFVERHHRFPCPADPKLTGADYGLEPMVRKCPGPKAEGLLPWRSLGISENFAKDGFKRWMTYVVDSNLADKEHEGHSQTIPGRQITLRNEQGFPVLVDPSTQNPNFVALILISHGESGVGALIGGAQGAKITSETASSPKRENFDGNFVFIESPLTDDILRWESRDHFLKHYVRGLNAP